MTKLEKQCNYKMTIAYDGTAYHGYEAKPDNEKTIEGTLTRTLASITGVTTRIYCCGRTDAGVHALRMVTSFTHPAISEEELKDKLNLALPEDIKVLEIVRAPKAFHARSSAHQKVYEYRIYMGDAKPVWNRKYCYVPPKRPSVDKIKEAIPYLIGRHDFRSFCGDSKYDKSTVKTIESIDLKITGDYLIITYTGNGFLRYMVRIMTGTLIDVGTGKIKASDLPSILEKKDRRYAGHTAPPDGLFLKDVVY